MATKKKSASKKAAAKKKAPTKKAPSKKAASTKKKSAIRKKAPSRKKAPVKKKAPARKKPSKVTANSLSGEDLFLYAQEAAYYLAEKDGFSGDPADYWAEAQKQLGLD